MATMDRAQQQPPVMPPGEDVRPVAAMSLFARSVPDAPLRVLIPVDFSPRCKAALQAAVMVTSERSELVLVHAVDPSTLGPKAVLAFASGLPFADQSILDDCRLHLQQLQRDCIGAERRTRVVVRTGHAAGEIVHAIAEHDPDLLLCTASPEPLGTCALGFRSPTIEHVLRSTACPVLVIAT